MPTKREDSLGTAVCPGCGTEYVLPPERRAQLGRQARCVTCGKEFPLVPRSAPLSLARQKEIIAGIHACLREMYPELLQLYRGDKISYRHKFNWCLQFLREGLNYADNIRLDCKVDCEILEIGLLRGQRVAIPVVVCDRFNNLADAHRRSAFFAQSLQTEWSLITNGNLWQLYRNSPQSNGACRQVQFFEVTLLQEDGLPPEAARLLYLLHPEAFHSGLTGRVHRHIANTPSQQAYHIPAVAPEEKELFDRLEPANLDWFDVYWAGSYFVDALDLLTFLIPESD